MFRLRPHALALAFAALLTAGVSAGSTCPFCTAELGKTMVDDYARAQVVLFGTFTNPRQGANGFDGTTDFEIETILKGNDTIKGAKTVTINKLINQPKVKFLLFCDVFKGRVDPYRADSIAEGSELVKYLTGAVKYKEGPLSERLKYCFQFLNSKEYEVSLDAYREFGAADYKEYQGMARDLDPKILKAWLSDEKTPPYRYGLYASLLGHCGKGKEDGDFLRNLIENTERHKGSGLDGMMVGYVMIQPKEGWQYLEKNILANAKNDFNTRYAGLRSLRFLWSQRPDLVDKKALVRGMMEAAEHYDIADFAIEDLRKWQRWECTDDILGLGARKTHDAGVIQRAVLRYMLQSPSAKAKTYVEQQTKRDPEQVRDTREILKLETDVAPPAPNGK